MFYLQALFCLSIYDETKNNVIEIGDYKYPEWATVVGRLIICSSLICVPIAAVCKLIAAKGTFIQVFYISIAFMKQIWFKFLLIDCHNFADEHILIVSSIWSVMCLLLF